MAPLRREQIVRATVRCLARDGYARLTMKKVAREAGVSQGILHYYFADKRAMLVATLTAVSRDVDRRVAAAQSRAPREPAARLRAVNAEVYTRTRRLLARLIADGVRAGRFRAVDPERAAAVVLGLVDGVSLQLTFDPRAFTVPEAARFCDDALARYLHQEDSA